MNDDFKEELKDCYVEIERLSEANTQVWADNERLRAALREIIRLDDEWVPETQDDYTYGGYQKCADTARAALEVHSIGHEDGLCPRERA